MEHQADVHPQLRLILPDAGPGCEKNGRRATWPVTTRSGRHQVPVAVLPTAKSLSAFSLKPQSDRLLGEGRYCPSLHLHLRQAARNLAIAVLECGIWIAPATLRSHLRMRNACPGCCAAPQARSRASSTRYGGALLIRGPLCTRTALGPRLCGASYRTMLRIAGRTLHRVRDTTRDLLLHTLSG